MEINNLPWSIADDSFFSDAAPVSIYDSKGKAVAAVASHNPIGDETSPEDYRIANLLRAAPEMCSILCRLLDWQAFMGGFEGRVWGDARDLFANLKSKLEG